MKRLFLLLALYGIVAVSCTEGGVDDNIDNDGNNTEQPGEDDDDENEIPDDAYISINKDILTFSPDGESVEVRVYSNYEWTLTNNCDWVTTSISGGEASEDGTAMTLTADLTYDDREGTIIFSCGKAKKLLVVSQSFKEAIIADENSVFNVPAEGGNVIINYQTTVECEVIIPEEAKSWISLAPETRGLESESATLTVAENTTYSERSAVVKVVKVGDNTLFAEYTINQVQNDAIIADENNTFNLNGLAQSINIAYQTNVECEVIISEEAKSWISLAPATRALVNESATLNIADNNTGAERSAVVKVVAANNNELVAEYTITQNQRYFMEYTSKGGDTVRPNDSSALDATIIRNEYIDGKGYIDFDAPITSIGDYAFYRCTSLTSITIPDSVTTIGKEAFWYCGSLTSVTIPDSVTEIGSSAFYECDSLTSVYITDIAAWCKISFGGNTSNPLYYAGNLYLNNELATDLIIPDGVTSIGNSAFLGCDSLTSVTIGNGVTSIGGGAFSGCTSLTSITIPDSVTEIGSSAFYECDSLTSVTIPDSVTSIGDHVFYDCTSLTSVTIGNGVTSIGEKAFYNCTSLTSVTIGNGVTSIGEKAFYNCTSLTSVTIPDSVTSIGNEAFYECASLTSVTIPDSVTSIGNEAFKYCKSLTSVYITDIAAWCNISFGNSYSNPLYYARNLYLNNELVTDLIIPNSVTSIGERAFYNCDSLTSITIPDSVTTIGNSAFLGCNSLTSVTIPDSVTSIGERAFYNCDSLTSVTIGKGVTSIGNEAFKYCDSLTSVYITDIAAWCEISFYSSDSNPLRYAIRLYLNNELVTDLIIPDGATKIGSYAFYLCTSLTSVTIPDSVTSIGSCAFDCCSKLTSITIPDSVTSIGSEAFYYCDSLTSVTIGNGVKSIGVRAFYHCDSLTSVTIGNGVKSIGGQAFEYCYSLTSVTIGNGVKSIGGSAFYNCNSLTSVTIPDSVTSIGGQAFEYCSSLTSVTIGKGVTSIGFQAFNGCTSLKDVYCKPTTPPTGSRYMFEYNDPDRWIYVPYLSEEAYKAASFWSDYASDIVGYLW